MFTWTGTAPSQKNLHEAMRGKHPSLLRNGVILLHANTRIHMADSKLIVKTQLGNRPSPTQPGFGTQWFSSISYPEKALVRTLFHLWWKHQMCYHQVVDIDRDINTYFQDWQTFPTLWQVPKLSTELCWKTEYQWHIHFVLSVFSIKMLPFIYG